MNAGPRVVLGMPAYKRPDTLQRTLESLLSQTYRDFALIIRDDAPSPETAAIVAAYASLDARVTYEPNSRHLGMVENWRHVFARARLLHPQCEYFAWVSDHDVWHVRWLEEMVAVLDTHPEVVLVYPKNLRMQPGDAWTTTKAFETFGMRGRGARMRHSARHMLAGDMIYGLVRADALAAAGVFRSVLTPDRQVLLALSLFGQVRQLPDVLWYREVLKRRAPFDRRRQRQAFFPQGAPLYAYLPSHVQHCATLLWDYGVRGRGRPAFGRAAAVGYAAVQLWFSVVRELVLPKADWRQRLAGLLPAAMPGPSEDARPKNRKA